MAKLKMSLSGTQLRGARGLLNVSIVELAELTGLAVNTIRRAEKDNGPSAVSPSTAHLLVTVLQGQGVVLIDEGDGMGPGVRLASTIPMPKRVRRRARAVRLH